MNKSLSFDKFQFIYFFFLLPDFERDFIRPVNHIGQFVMLAILNLPIYEHELSLHLFMSLISFSNFCNFLCTKPFVSLVKFILKYFALILS